MKSSDVLLFVVVVFAIFRNAQLGGTYIITDIRLVNETGMTHSSQGRVELQLDYNADQWYGICQSGSNDPSHHSWNRMSANVACRQLGFLGGWNYSIQGLSTRYTLEDFRCSLETETLDDCYYDYPELCGCSPSRTLLDDFLLQCNYEEHHQQYQAAVKCYETENMRVRLVPDKKVESKISKSSYGKLEIFYGNRWFDVCFNGTSVWTDNDATVACRQMGFELGAIETKRHEGIASRSYSSSSFKCLGTERHLFECLPDPPRNQSCDDNDQVFIRCNVSSDGETSGETTLSTLDDAAQSATDWAAAGTIIGALVFITLIVFGIVFLICYLKRTSKPKDNLDDRDYHDYHVVDPMPMETNHGVNNLYEELGESHESSPPEYYYPYTDLNNRPALPMRQVTDPGDKKVIL